MGWKVGKGPLLPPWTSFEVLCSASPMVTISRKKGPLRPWGLQDHHPKSPHFSNRNELVEGVGKLGPMEGLWPWPCSKWTPFSGLSQGLYQPAPASTEVSTFSVCLRLNTRIPKLGWPGQSPDHVTHSVVSHKLLPFSESSSVPLR